MAYITRQEYKDIVWNLALKCKNCAVGRYGTNYAFDDGSYVLVGSEDVLFFRKNVKCFSLVVKG